MNVRSNSIFDYRFRAPDSAVAGPIRHAAGQTRVGAVLVARSSRGVCAIFLGDDADALSDALASAFPGVELIEDPRALQRELAQVIAFIEREPEDGTVVLDVGGSAFEQQVWQALCEIPSGETRSYGDIARKLDMPDAARGVAGACAANVLALAIPCHRVLRSDGTISGYRWGVARKRALLAAELDA
jgi:O-6-methylguanine DNA methyltransferase